MLGMRSLIQGSIQHSFGKSEPQHWLHVSCMQDPHLISETMMQGIHEQHPSQALAKSSIRRMLRTPAYWQRQMFTPVLREGGAAQGVHEQHVGDQIPGPESSDRPQLKTVPSQAGLHMPFESRGSGFLAQT